MKLLSLSALALASACQNAAMAEVDSFDAAASLYGFSVKNIDGKIVKLNKYKGKVVLIVNVASKCGYTPQYGGLEKLYQDYKGKGLVILGFPANDFGGQEPGTDAEIKTFCSTKYNVTFPMFSKISVKDRVHPLYEWLIKTSDRPSDAIEWNFSKFLVGKDGQVVARFKSGDAPESADLRAAINEALRG